MPDKFLSGKTTNRFMPITDEETTNMVQKYADSVSSMSNDLRNELKEIREDYIPRVIDKTDKVSDRVRQIEQYMSNYREGDRYCIEFLDNIIVRFAQNWFIRFLNYFFKWYYFEIVGTYLYGGKSYHDYKIYIRPFCLYDKAKMKPVNDPVHLDYSDSLHLFKSSWDTYKKHMKELKKQGVDTKKICFRFSQ